MLFNSVKLLLLAAAAVQALPTPADHIDARDDTHVLRPRGKACKVKQVAIAASVGPSSSASAEAASIPTTTSAEYVSAASIPTISSGNSASAAPEATYSGSPNFNSADTGYEYKRLPQGITLASSGTDVGFLKDTTGGPTLQAPQPDDEVPADAAIYHPSSPTMNMKDFRLWHDNIKNTNGGGTKKWIKVAPGVYEFSKGSGYPYEWNNNMEFNGYTGWTLDLRGCTFIETRLQGETDYSDQMLYVNNCYDFTVLGGTFWVNDDVEMFTQGKVVSLSDGDSGTAIIEVDEGYNYTAWGAGAAPGAYSCIDVSDPEHYWHPPCNFWYQSNVKLLGDNKVQADFASRSGVKAGMYLTIHVGGSPTSALATMECDGNVRFRGTTSNAVFFDYGKCSEEPLVLENCLTTSLPAFKGRAPRVFGPTMSYGNYGSALFIAEGMPPINFIDSWWQFTGNPNDLTSLANYLPPPQWSAPM